MHFGQNPVAADLAYSIYGEGGKRALAHVLKQTDFTKDYIWPLGIWK